MFKLLLIILLTLMPVFSQADNSQLLNDLDAAISQRGQFITEKNTSIGILKQKVRKEKDSIEILKVVDELFQEYCVFKFDSALAYANQGLSAAERLGNLHYRNLFNIHVAEILAIGGLYSEAIGHLDQVDITGAGHEILFKLYYTYFSVYSYWSDYCSDQLFSPKYRQKANEHLRRAMHYADENDPMIRFYQGEQNVYVEPNSHQARTLYHNILNTADEKSRLFAMASFALAGNYRVGGNEEKYEEYLIKAALSDLKCCTMENLALQSLAVFLFQSDASEIERAERYINVSMEDAKFYGNRLRILEISRILPQIMTTYQTAVEKQNRNLRNSIIFISLLVVGLLFTAYFILQQNRKLTARRKALAENNLKLHDLNQQLADSHQHQVKLNSQLQELNQRLVDTNKRRESLASIYIDLCAKYIDKLGKYQILVKRKIKANQAQELLQAISSTRISEEDATTFLTRFDKAFLELYPTFVEEFNALLQEDGRIQQKSPHTLTTELRTFALIRLGVKNTADIAGLLFLSTQTIYNCRSVVKSKAISKDTFDDDVQQLCRIIHA